MNASTARQRLDRKQPWLGCLVVAFLAFLFSMSEGRAQNATREYQLKAAFLYNFSKFVEWPVEKFPTTNSPIVIGVFGQNPFEGELEKIIRGRTLHGHPFQVKTVHSSTEACLAQILFVHSSEEKRFVQISQDLKKGNVLTVGESEEFSNLGGIITLVLVKDKIQFDINMIAAEQAQLKVSSQLQKLANNIKR